jgi:hypothetical protein
MSETNCIFDVFVRSYADNSPVATLTIGLPVSKSTGQNDKHDNTEVVSGKNLNITHLKNLIYENAIPEWQLIPAR